MTDANNARRQLGELGVMSHQTIEMERRILERAQTLVTDVVRKIDAARAAAMTGGEAEQQAYMDLIMERGKLEQVIAQAKQALA